MWRPYIKPTRRIHGSGFRCFECGYCQIDDDTNRVVKKAIVGCSADHIYNYSFCIADPIRLDMDLTRDGYIRIFSIDRTPLYWSIPGWSDAQITTHPMISETEIEELYLKQQEEKNG